VLTKRYGRLGRQGSGKVLQIDIGDSRDLAIRLGALVQVFEQYLEVVLIQQALSLCQVEADLYLVDFLQADQVRPFPAYQPRQSHGTFGIVRGKNLVVE
jgi:hypothetical protein